jgi:hypothetical protein
LITNASEEALKGLYAGFRNVYQAPTRQKAELELEKLDESWAAIVFHSNQVLVH